MRAITCCVLSNHMLCVCTASGIDPGPVVMVHDRNPHPAHRNPQPQQPRASCCSRACRWTIWIWRLHA
jgi:hypothetical protein